MSNETDDDSTPLSYSEKFRTIQHPDYGKTFLVYTKPPNEKVDLILETEEHTRKEVEQIVLELKEEFPGTRVWCVEKKQDKRGKRNVKRR